MDCFVYVESFKTRVDLVVAPLPEQDACPNKLWERKLFVLTSLASHPNSFHFHFVVIE